MNNFVLHDSIFYIFYFRGTYDPLSSYIQRTSVTISGGGTVTIPRSAILTNSYVYFSASVAGWNYVIYGYGTYLGSTTNNNTTATGWGSAPNGYYAMIKSFDANNISIYANKTCTLYYSYYSSGISHHSLTINQGSSATLDISKVELGSSVAVLNGSYYCGFGASSANVSTYTGPSSSSLYISAFSGTTATFTENGSTAAVTLYYSTRS